MLRLFLVAFAFFGTVTGALAGNPFEITGIRIDAVRENVSKAREQAIRVGTLDATYRLLDRLTLPEDRLVLDPPLIITEDIAEQLVAGIEISNEKRSRSRYLGELAVTFDAQAIRAFLRANHLPYVESQALPVHIIAIWKNEEGQAVLMPDNPFTTALKDGNFQNHLVPLKIVDLDVTEENEAAIAWRLANFNTQLLSEISINAGINELIIASARRTGPDRVTISARRVFFEDGGVSSIMNMGNFEGIAPSSGRRPNILQTTLKMAMEKLADVLDTDWKHTAIVRDNFSQSIRLTALYNGIKQWQRIRDALGSVSLVEEARLEALSADGALLTLTYRGNEDQLIRRLAQKGIELQNDDLGLVARIR